MRYTEFKVGDNEYKLRLGATEIRNLEKEIGGNALSIVGADGNLPTLTGLLLGLHRALKKFHSGIKLSDVDDIYDEYVDDGGSFEDLIDVILEVFEVSGFFSEKDLEKAKEMKEQAKGR